MVTMDQYYQEQLPRGSLTGHYNIYGGAPHIVLHGTYFTVPFLGAAKPLYISAK